MSGGLIIGLLVEDEIARRRECEFVSHADTSTIRRTQYFVDLLNPSLDSSFKGSGVHFSLLILLHLFHILFINIIPERAKFSYYFLSIFGVPDKSGHEIQPDISTMGKGQEMVDRGPWVGPRKM